MSWPPMLGEPLPRAAEAVGVREKLINYSLDVGHERGGTKARGFKRILGITIRDIDYLEEAIRRAILTAPVSAVRAQTRYGIHCEVRIEIRGLRDKRARAVTAITGWELAYADAVPRMTTAYLRP